MTGVFAEWQPAYAERGIPTFPCRPDKRPAVSNYAKFGMHASTAIAGRFASADALGFMCGKRSALTVLDIDSKEERVLAEALDRHGPTPIIVRSGSGNFQAWYRHGGERRHIRPEKNVPIDILGGGYVVAPPSRVEKGRYEFIEGWLDDVGNLPTLKNTPTAKAQSPSQPELRTEWASKREGDGRNNALFRSVARAAQKVDDFDQLLDCARTQNEQFAEPMVDDEVVKIATSVWTMQCEGRNRFGQIGAWVPLELMRNLKSDLVALGLYTVLRAENGPDSIFPIANAMSKTVGASLYQFRKARKLIIELSLVEQVSSPTQHRPALYRWPRSDWSDQGCEI